MRIYIDEAGSFVPPTSQQSSYSLVLALVVPSSCESQLCYQLLNGHLQKPGWQHFGKLVVYNPKSSWLIALGPNQGQPVFPRRVVEVWKALSRFSKPMLTK